jgi:hypothetical protein
MLRQADYQSCSFTRLDLPPTCRGLILSLEKCPDVGTHRIFRCVVQPLLHRPYSILVVGQSQRFRIAGYLRDLNLHQCHGSPFEELTNGKWL